MSRVDTGSIIYADWDFDEEALLEKFNLESGGLVQQTIDRDVITFSEPYVPMAEDGGALAASAWAFSDIGGGRIVYGGPDGTDAYARYMYYGVVYGPNKPIFEHGNPDPVAFYSPRGKKKYPKIGQIMDYYKGHHRLAGPRWFEAMKADRLQDILEDAKNAVRK